MNCVQARQDRFKFQRIFIYHVLKLSKENTILNDIISVIYKWAQISLESMGYK